MCTFGLSRNRPCHSLCVFCELHEDRIYCIQIVPFKDHQGICLIAKDLIVRLKGFNVEYDVRLWSIYYLMFV